MKRFILSVAPWGLVLVLGVPARSAEDLAQTARYVEALQNPDGGFAPRKGAPSTLGTTSSAIRILKNVGGSIPDVLACVKYVASCRDAASGGYAPTPGGTPDVRTTAIGLMAEAELLQASDAISEGAVGFLGKHVKSFEEIRIAVAGLEAVKKSAPEFGAWTRQVQEMRNEDGTFGHGPGQARDTGGAAVALLRMGVELDKKEAALKAMRAGQRPDGAWSKGEGPSDLEATYRIMRCFYMLKEKPDLDAVRKFIARCRQPDGSYAVRAGGTGDLSGTYFATTVLRWVRLLAGEPALVETAGFHRLFNGTDLTGWEGDTSLWSAQGGMIVGTSPGLKHNDFLATEKSYGDFILKLTFRVQGPPKSNSGVQFRSVRIPGHEMSGYQADIGQGYWGCLYDESRRRKVLERASDQALETVRTSEWNHYTIRAMGNRVTLTLNGVTSVKYVEEDPDIARTGKIAVQIHAGAPMIVQFKDIWIQPLPEPTADRLEEPGFHLRTVKTEQGERKYSVFVPNGYDGTKTFPVVLFLHGSGERGDDGIMSAQVGLGAAIFQRPEAYPFLAVFPQARETWKAGSDDAKAALTALDDVMNHYKTDRRRVILTGLSMGGSGSWGLADTATGRFAAVVPVCGRGEVAWAEHIKPLPTWFFVGDADREQTVLNGRAMVEALRAAGGTARVTEYRGVGHNSWDRAYSDPELIHWMLARTPR